MSTFHFSFVASKISSFVGTPKLLWNNVKYWIALDLTITAGVTVSMLVKDLSKYWAVRSPYLFNWSFKVLDLMSKHIYLVILLINLEMESLTEIAQLNDGVLELRHVQTYRHTILKRYEGLFTICFANQINETGWHAASTDAHVWRLQNSKITNKKTISFLYVHHLFLFSC